MTKAVPIIDIFKKPEDDTTLANVVALSTSKVEEELNNIFESLGNAPVNSCRCHIWAYKNDDISTGSQISQNYSGPIAGIAASAGGDLNGVLTAVYGFESEVDRITIVFVFVIEE